MKTPIIEFNEPTDDLITCSSPWSGSGTSTYQDLILKSAYASRRFKFPLGTTWFRIVPALKTSDKGWMLGIQALNYSGGRHAHPRTFASGNKSAFDHAYAWCKENREEALYSKTNRNGYKLLSDPICLFWMITEIDGKPVARLILASGYDGSRGGTPGLGHQIWQLTQEKDENGNLLGNPADPESGTQISIEKTQVPSSSYPSYRLKRGRIPTSVSELIGNMDPEEIAALAPLEGLAHRPTEEEEWQLLENVIDRDTIRRIRAPLA